MSRDLVKKGNRLVTAIVSDQETLEDVKQLSAHASGIN